MEYIIELKSRLDDSQRALLATQGRLTFESVFIPLVFIDTHSPDKVAALDFVNRVRAPEQGTFLEGEFLDTLFFQPPVLRNPLRKGQMVGWNTKVAILDSGVNLRGIEDSIDYTGTGSIDLYGHGTKVATIIKHFASGAKLYSAKIGTFAPEELYVMRALEWAAMKGMNVINLSAGFARECDGTCSLCQLVNAIPSTGVATVVAAGNGGRQPDSISCPGRAVNAVTVGSVQENKKLASFSSIGNPGDGKPNLIASGIVRFNADVESGTSFSAPIVSGVIAAVLKKVGNVSTALEYLYKTAEDLGLPAHYQGHGLMNIEKLVEAINNDAASSTGALQSPTPT